jgi:hypothetical protein
MQLTKRLRERCGDHPRPMAAVAMLNMQVRTRNQKRRILISQQGTLCDAVCLNAAPPFQHLIIYHHEDVANVLRSSVHRDTFYLLNKVRHANPLKRPVSKSHHIRGPWLTSPLMQISEGATLRACIGQWRLLQQVPLWRRMWLTPPLPCSTV